MRSRQTREKCIIYNIFVMIIYCRYGIHFGGRICFSCFLFSVLQIVDCAAYQYVSVDYFTVCVY